MLMRCAALLFLFALATPAMATPPDAAVTKAGADAPRTTSAGTQFVVPAGWSMHASGSKVTLDPPEAGSRAVLVDVKAADADAAVAQAWKAYGPAKTWPLHVATDSSPRDDWEQIRVYSYETSANDKRGVTAIAYRRGDQYTVLRFKRF